MSHAEESVSIWLDKWRGKLRRVANEELRPQNQTDSHLVHDKLRNFTEYMKKIISIYIINSLECN